MTVVNETKMSEAFPHGDHTSDWIYPPPVNRTFLYTWLERKKTLWPREINETDRNAIFAIEAGRDDVRPRPKAPGAGSIGTEDVAVHVGDSIMTRWKTWPEGDDQQGQSGRSIQMDCVLCSLGVANTTDGSGAGDAHGIFEACGNYTDSVNFSRFKKDVDRLGAEYQQDGKDYAEYEFSIPNLYREIYIPDDSVGICAYGLDWGDTDYSVSFAVKQRRRSVPFRFSTDVPNGEEDPSLSGNNPLVVATGSKEGSGNGLGTGEIVGVVLGVLLGVGLSMVAAWWVWKKHKRKGVKPAVVESAELGRIRAGGVVRNTDTERDDDGEVPPPYHEVVNVKNDIDTYV